MTFKLFLENPYRMNRLFWTPVCIVIGIATFIITLWIIQVGENRTRELVREQWRYCQTHGC